MGRVPDSERTSDGRPKIEFIVRCVNELRKESGGTPFVTWRDLSERLVKDFNEFPALQEQTRDGAGTDAKGEAIWAAAGAEKKTCYVKKGTKPSKDHVLGGRKIGAGWVYWVLDYT